MASEKDGKSDMTLQKAGKSDMTLQKAGKSNMASVEESGKSDMASVEEDGESDMTSEIDSKSDAETKSDPVVLTDKDMIVTTEKDYKSDETLDINRERPPRRLEWAERRPSDWSGFCFTEVRKAFIRKVYVILALQMTFATGIILIFVLEKTLSSLMSSHEIVIYIAVGLEFVAYMGLICCQETSRRYPENILVLSTFTIVTSFVLGVASSFFETEAYAIAVGLCAILCFSVSTLSLSTKFDATSCGGIMSILIIILCCLGIIAVSVRSKVLTMIYAALGASVFLMYLAFDTQLLMSGKTVDINLDEYVFAAVQVYIDFVNIPIYLLNLFFGDDST